MKEKQYFPVIVLAEFDSPIDALIHLGLSAGDALDIVNAAYPAGFSDCFMATLKGGRAVAALRAPENRWIAGHAFPEPFCATPAAAERRLKKLLKKGRRGLVGVIESPVLRTAT